jgi:hypothetical protein
LAVSGDAAAAAAMDGRYNYIKTVRKRRNCCIASKSATAVALNSKFLMTIFICLKSARMATARIKAAANLQLP